LGSGRPAPARALRAGARTVVIIDATIFHSELEMLEIRLHVLAPAVDRFVIVESDRTFSGKPKPYVLADHLDAFSQFPIWYRQISQTLDGNAWDREEEQRDALRRVAEPFADDDKIILSDVDEIPAPNVVRDLITQHPTRLGMRNFYFYLNAESPDPWMGGTIVTTGKYARGKSWHWLRNRPYTDPVANGGWHFGSCLSPDRVVEKLGAFSHTEFDNDEAKARVLKYRSEGLDIHGHALNVVPIDHTFPDYIRENQDRYRDLIL
jgi:beta-1,4-mannosyl-glycoprotein beta-1,4-N-acetylglucosaminyltransferase